MEEVIEDSICNDADFCHDASSTLFFFFNHMMSM